MDNSRIGILGGVCALLLVIVALVLWVQTQEPSTTNGQVSDVRGAGSLRPAPADRDEEAATHESNDSEASSESPPVRIAGSPDAVIPAASDPQQRADSPGMSEDHPLGRPLEGWKSASELNELGAAERGRAGSADGVFVHVPEGVDPRDPWGHRMGTFDPSNPDGALELRLRARDFAGEGDTSLHFEAVAIRSTDQASWRVTDSGGETAHLLVPVADGDTFQVQLRATDGRTALGYLPVPGSLSRHGLRSRDLYRRGRVKLTLRLVAPGQQPRARGIQVADAAGKPVADAVILQGGQEFGRSDAAGVIDWPFPPPTPNNIGKVMLHERGFILSAPGYVPAFVPREDVADPRLPPLQVKLKAREFVASVWGGTIDERFMCLAPNTFSDNWYDSSEILALGWDLLPLEPGAQVASWEDAFYYLAFNGYGREKLARIRKLFPENNYQSVGRDRRRPEARPFFNGSSTRWSSRSVSWPDGLEAAVGRPYHDLWTDFYGGWYNGRWRYDAGRFDVVLPYPGKFLLLVGEEFREGMTGSKPGQINHVLYINALDPANVKGELFRCPG